MEYGSGTTPHFQEVDQVRCEVRDGLSLHLKESLSTYVSWFTDGRQKCTVPLFSGPTTFF